MKLPPTSLILPWLPMERSRRSKKPKRSSEALKSLRRAREEGVSRTDDLEVRIRRRIQRSPFACLLTLPPRLFPQFDQDDSVYETVTHDEYTKIVQKRRSEQSFVVDDGARVHNLSALSKYLTSTRCCRRARLR